MILFVKATKTEVDEIMQNAARLGCNSVSNGKYLHGSVVLFERKHNGVAVSSNALSQIGSILDYLPAAFRDRAAEL